MTGANIAERKPARRRGAGARADTKAPTIDKLNGIGTEAVKKATGKGWDEWLATLDADGAAGMTHQEIAVHLQERHGVGDWWCQMVTVGYEQGRGRREKHQKPDGYEVSGSKTISVPIERAFKAFKDARVRSRWLPGEAITVRGATPGKSMRITWSDGASNVIVAFYPKGPGKCQVTIQHGKLKNAAAGKRMKAFWGERLAALKEMLEV